MEACISSIGGCVSRMTSGNRLRKTCVDPLATGGFPASTHKKGFASDDMALLSADWKTVDLCASALAQRKLPHRVRKRSGDYHPGADAIQVMTMKVSKGLEFPVVALPGVGHMPAPGEDEKEAARVFYVAATRATQKSVMGSGMSLRLQNPYPSITSSCCLF